MTTTVDHSTLTLDHLPIESIFPNPNNPPQRSKGADIAELAASIEQEGLLQPLVVLSAAAWNTETRPKKQQIVDIGVVVYAGHRRLAALKKLGWSMVPVIYRDDLADGDEDGHLAMLIENLQSKDLDPLQEARAFEKVLKDKGWKQQDLAKRIGVNPAYVSRRLYLLKVPKEVMDLVASGKLEMSAAVEIAKAGGAEAIARVAAEVVESEDTYYGAAIPTSDVAGRVNLDRERQEKAKLRAKLSAEIKAAGIEELTEDPHRTMRDARDRWIMCDHNGTPVDGMNGGRSGWSLADIIAAREAGLLPEEIAVHQHGGSGARDLPLFLFNLGKLDAKKQPKKVMTAEDKERAQQKQRIADRERRLPALTQAAFAGVADNPTMCEMIENLAFSGSTRHPHFPAGPAEVGKYAAKILGLDLAKSSGHNFDEVADDAGHPRWRKLAAAVLAAHELRFTSSYHAADGIDAGFVLYASQFGYEPTKAEHTFLSKHDPAQSAIDVADAEEQSEVDGRDDGAVTTSDEPAVEGEAVPTAAGDAASPSNDEVPLTSVVREDGVEIKVGLLVKDLDDGVGTVQAIVPPQADYDLGRDIVKVTYESGGLLDWYPADLTPVDPA